MGLRRTVKPALQRPDGTLPESQDLRRDLVWFVRIGRSQRDLCRELATDARPPLGPSKPFRPPLLRRWERVWPAQSDDAGTQDATILEE